METTDYRKITHTAKSNEGKVQKLIVDFNSAHFIQKNLTISNYVNDLLCFYAEKMQRSYEKVKAFNGQVCSKAQNAQSHKLNVEDLKVNPNIKPLFFGSYKLMVYFLPDYTVEKD